MELKKQEYIADEFSQKILCKKCLLCMSFGELISGPRTQKYIIFTHMKRKAVVKWYKKNI